MDFGDTDDLHDWFGADGFRVETEEYGEVDLWVVGGDLVERDVWVDGSYGGTRWGFPLEGDCGDDGYRAFSASLVQAKHEDEPTLSVAEMVEPDEYEDLTIGDVEEIEDDE